MCLANVEVQEGELDNFVAGADERVEQTVNIRGVRFREVRTFEGAFFFPVCGGEHQTLATCKRNTSIDFWGR